MLRWKKAMRSAALGLASGLLVYTNVFADLAVTPFAAGEESGLVSAFGGTTPGAEGGLAIPGTQGNGFDTSFETGGSSNSSSGTAGPTSGTTGPTTETTGSVTGTTNPTTGNAGTAGPTSGTSGGTTYPSRLPAVSATVTTEQGTSGNAQGNTTGSAQGNLPQGNAQGALAKPTVQSQGAVLFDATHNQFLFEQNADTRYYPASITKLMTALLVLEHSGLDEIVTFSENAVTNLESGAVTLKVAAGDQISVRDCMYGLLLKSANEVANGLAEHVAGSVGAFAEMMNQKAAQLGCTNTHFVNPNGLNDSNHYTTPRDMALIANAAFANPILCQIDSTINYNFPATKNAPTVRPLTMGHKMLNPANPDYYYPGVVGGKTGYTSLAGNTLVTCAEQNGVRLIAVVMKSKQSHYADTKALLDYGFSVQSAGNSSQTPGAESGPAGSTGGQASSPQNANTSPGGQTVNGGNRWAQDAGGWRFVKADGSYAANECLMINGELYCFKADQFMVSNSWYSIDGIWYYFRPSGGLAKSRWVETNGYWYYVDGNGSLAVNTTTPDGFKVDGNGVWVQQ